MVNWFRWFSISFQGVFSGSKCSSSRGVPPLKSVPTVSQRRSVRRTVRRTCVNFYQDREGVMRNKLCILTLCFCFGNDVTMRNNLAGEWLWYGGIARGLLLLPLMMLTSYDDFVIVSVIHMTTTSRPCSCDFKFNKDAASTTRWNRVAARRGLHSFRFGPWPGRSPAVGWSVM